MCSALLPFREKKVTLIMRQLPKNVRLLLVSLALVMSIYYLSKDPQNSALQAHSRVPCSRTTKKIFIGVLTTIDRFHRRALIRATYLSAKPSSIDVYFVLCRKPLMEQGGWKTLVRLEQEQYKDILLLDCHENMNNGKTLNYLRTVSNLYQKKDYIYYAKTDDDTFINLSSLEKKLIRLPAKGKLDKGSFTIEN
jgi:hypothetical protein